MNKTTKDLTNLKFGKLTAIKINGKAKDGSYLWECLCECGNKYSVMSHLLRSGKRTNCGCVQIQHIKDANTKHGFSYNNFYRCWSSMKGRCHNKNNAHYKHYGGRGIKYQESWKEFINFKNDMYESYLEHSKEYGERETTIDRQDNNGNYTKENCKWKTYLEQQNNKRSNRVIEYNGEKLTLTEISRKYNINANTLFSRIESGWSIDKAINKEIKQAKEIRYKNENIKITELASRFNMTYNQLFKRLADGWEIEKALKTPFRERKIS